MAKPLCGICGQNEAIVIFTDLSDGHTISPCPVCFPEVVDYVVSIATALEELMAIPPGEIPPPPERPVEAPEGDNEDEQPSETPTTPQGRNGRTPRTSPKAGTDDDLEMEDETDETADVASTS